MSLDLTPLLVSLALVWLPMTLLTFVGGRRRDESVLRAVLGGLAYPVTWVSWFVEGNRRAGRSPFRSR